MIAAFFTASGKRSAMNFAAPTWIRRARIGRGLEHARREPLDVRGGVGGDLDQLALHHRDRAGFVFDRARPDQREDVVLARPLHGVALVQDLRVVVHEHQPASVDPAEAVAELDEGLDRAVDARGRHRDDAALVGDHADLDRGVGDTLVGRASRRGALAARGSQGADHRGVDPDARAGPRHGSRHRGVTPLGLDSAGRRTTLPGAAGADQKRQHHEERANSKPHSTAPLTSCDTTGSTHFLAAALA